MKVVRIQDATGTPRFATLDDEGTAHLLTATTWEEIHAGTTHSGETVAAAQVQLLPVVAPSKIIGMAMAYLQDPNATFQPGVDRDPFFFLKPPSAIISHDDAIEVPAIAAGAVFESELAVIVGKRCKAVSAEEALEYVAGYTICNDMSAPAVMTGDGQWSRGKGFDTFCPIGPVMETELQNPEDTRIVATLTRDGEELKLVDSTTAKQIWSVAQSIAYASEYITLEPGDVVSMGCPPGPIPVRDGDIVTITLDGIGTLRNPVVQL